MTHTLNSEQLKFYVQAIRVNHYDFYKKVAQNCPVISEVNKEYKFLMSEQMEWPNIIYDLQINNDSADEIMKNLALRIDNKELPSFLIIDTLAKSDNFESVARNNGFRPVMRWPGMVFQSPLTEKKTELPQGFSVKKISNIGELNQWVFIHNKTLFPGKGLIAELIKPLMHTKDISLFLAYYNDQPVSAMLVNYHESSAGIFMASTHPNYSGRGFMTTLLNYVTKNAKSQGYNYTILEATKQSYKLYSSLGFNDVCNFDIYWKINN